MLYGTVVHSWVMDVSKILGMQKHRCMHNFSTFRFRARSMCSRSSFCDFVRPELALQLKKMGCSTPNEMQAKALGFAIAGNDVLIRAQTGAGKTLAFLLPLVQHLSYTSRQAKIVPNIARPETLIIVPTAELGGQLTSVASELMEALPEAPRVGRMVLPEDSATALSSSRLIVATPSELSRRKREGLVELDELQAVALDEADLLLFGELHGAKEPHPLEAELFCRTDASTSCVYTQPQHTSSPRLSARRGPQLLMATATLNDERQKEILRRFPTARLVSERGDLAPTLRQRFHYFRMNGDERLLKVLPSRHSLLPNASTCETVAYSSRVATIDAHRAD